MAHPVSRRCVAFALAMPLCLLHATALQAATPPREGDYPGAKATADADEASLDGPTRVAMLQAQRALLDAAAAACATPRPDLGAFVVVMRLDDTGRVSQTWRRGHGPLALCVERYVRGKPLPAPPRSPFLVSLEVSFEK